MTTSWHILRSDMAEAVAQPEWDRRSNGPPRDKLAKVVTGVLYQFSIVRK